MTKKSNRLKIAAVGDLHVRHGLPSLSEELFSKASKEADVLLLCGDLTNLGLPEEAKLLAKDLSSCSIPVMAVTGNHDYESDQIGEIKRILQEAKVVFLEDEPFEMGGIGFVGVKGFAGGFGNHLLGSFGEQSIKTFVSESVKEAMKLENHLRLMDNDRIVVVLHYSPIAETVKGEPPEIFPFMGSSRLEETISRYGKVKAVFHGHSHHGSFLGRTSKNIPVYNCCFHVIKKHFQKPYALIEL